MRTDAAILRELGARWEVVELDLDEPRQNEVTVQLVGSGLCHSEVHVASGEMSVSHLPVCGGHEGAGVVVAVGPNTPGFAEGDHVVLAALPSCGRCRWCQGGQSNLCDYNQHLMSGARFEDPDSYRMHLDGEPVGQLVGLGAFSRYTTVSTVSVVKIDPDLPLDRACLVGCAVSTGWGSAVNMAAVEPGQTVIVIGVGGIGAFAVQGAVHGGATSVIAVDPILTKHERIEQLGATHTCAHIDEAAEIARSLTRGQGADSTIVCVGHLERETLSQALASIRKGGTVVVTGLGDQRALDYPLSLADLTLSQKRIQGSMYGGMSVGRDVPRLLHMYARGQLKLDEVITTRYRLEQINDGYDDMAAGRNIRGIIVFD
jgi:S-(hydroxymethyl)glutathione dehydrogenase/alcohol dehydrogenase